MGDDTPTAKVSPPGRFLRRLRRLAYTAIGVFLLSGLGSLLALHMLGAQAPQDVTADCIFVPGAAVWRKRKPSDALEARLIKALELYRARRAPVIVCSGGGAGDYLESAVMAEWFEQRGVPREAIVLESASRTTRENAVLSAPLLRQRDIKSALVVSQWFHVGRVRVSLEQEGVRTFAVNCQGPPLVSEPIFVARELVALPLYAVRLDMLR